MMKKIVIILAAAALFLASFTSYQTMTSKAQANSGEIWTTIKDCGHLNLEVDQFSNGDWVYINGKDFDPGTYEWAVMGPADKGSDYYGKTVAFGEMLVDESGLINIPVYQIMEEDTGLFYISVGNKQTSYSVNIATGSVRVTIGSCKNPTGISRTEVTFTLVNAILNIDGKSYDGSVTLYLEPGVYDYVWVGKPGYAGGECLTLIIEGCEQEPTPTSTPTSTSTSTTTPTVTATSISTITPTVTLITTSTTSVTSTVTPTKTPEPEVPPITGVVGLPDILLGLGVFASLSAVVLFIVHRKRIA